MSSVINSVEMSNQWSDNPSERLRFECGIMAGRLAALLRQRLADDENGVEKPVAAALKFLEHRYQEVAGEQPLSAWLGSVLDRRRQDIYHPLDLLAYSFRLSHGEVDLLILTGLAEEHEGYADIFRTLHPLGIARPTLGLAAQLFCNEPEMRSDFCGLIEAGAALGQKMIVREGEEPFYTCHLQLADALWSVLHGIDAWPKALKRVTSPVAQQGLSHWFKEPIVALAHQALSKLSTCTIVLMAETEEVAFQRAAALAIAAGVQPIRIEWPAEAEVNLESLLQIHCVARGAVAVVRLPEKAETKSNAISILSDCPGPVMLAARIGSGAVNENRPLINIIVEHLTSADLQTMWREALPELKEEAALLAARFPLEPSRALQVAEDLRFSQREQGGDVTTVTIEDVAKNIRARAAIALGGGVQLVRPVSGWDQLVLPELQRVQLQEAVNRLYLQDKVLDDWRFLKGRRGARGVRMLFAGPPGTGKTLSAEVLAKALDMDLLLVDLSSVVSKWIGETEKNLAEVFETAERAKAVLFFDEADSLFGKRTDVSDAHDRYANLETAYLLSRLERFDGLAVLATNLRQNIDTAFTRRLEFIIEYEEPGYEQRLALWRCHLPQTAPLADDVRLEELASHYPIVGGLIRNAAVAAAFLAAADQTAITKAHFIQAIRREYEKAGKAYRELPTTANRY